MMLVGKRPPSAEDAFDPMLKRLRIEDVQLRADLERYLRSDLEAGRLSVDGARIDIDSCRTDMDHVCSFHEDSNDPVAKRLRVYEPASSSGGDHDDAQCPALEAWAEKVVRALHGCPSVQEAGQRCLRVLAEFRAETRQAAHEDAAAAYAQQEAEQQEAAGDTRNTEERLAHTNRVLMRAVHHLADRVKRAEASANGSTDEVASLRALLEQADDEKRRLAHSNEMLKGHVRAHLQAVPQLSTLGAVF